MDDGIADMRIICQRGEGVLRLVVALSCSLLLCTADAQTQGESATQLESAWEEYGYQAFGRAWKLFSLVENASDAQPEQRLQARLGLAFITHYQMPGRDPEAAIPRYESLLADAPNEPAWRVLLLARLGDCQAEQVPPRMEQARAYYRQALDSAPDTSLIVQETILRLLTTYLDAPDPDEFARGLTVAREFAPRMQGTHFESIFYGLQGELAFFLGDMERMATALAEQYRHGINNVQVKEKVLFQLARLHEVELRDFDRAEFYYRELASRVPSSVKAHFSRLRADELQAGKIHSDYAPALPPRAGNVSEEGNADGR
jgi:tetratricopeptide (TPR) repeat protein